MSEVSWKTDKFYIMVFMSYFFQNTQTIICTAVIYKYKFMFPTGIFYLFQDFICFFIEFS